MPFEKELPVWAKVGTKPPAAMLDTTGWAAGDKPPADWLNWFFNLSYEAIKELQLESINADQKGVINGVATLGSGGKIPSTQLSLSDATTAAKGVVMLDDSTTSTSSAKAATPKAVKLAYDRAEEAFQSANDGKVAVAGAVTAKGVTASPAETFSQLATKIGLIQTGAKIKTIQRGSTVISSIDKVVTITAVDLTKSYLTFEMRPIANADPSEHRIRGKLNATSINFARFDLGVNVNIDWVVVEFESNVSVQRGSGSWKGYTSPANTPTNGNDIAIATVDPNKSFGIISHSTDETALDLYNWHMGVGPLMPNKLTIYTSKFFPDKPNLIYEWQVVSFT